jgi:hypothetical protein
MGLWSPTRVKVLRPTNYGNSYPMAAIPDTGTSLPRCRIPSSRPFNALMVKRPVTGMGSAMPSVALMMILTSQVLVSSRITRLQLGGLNLRLTASPIRVPQCSVNSSMYPDLARLDCWSPWAAKRLTGRHGLPHRTSYHSNRSISSIQSPAFGPVRWSAVHNHYHARTSALSACKVTTGHTKYA